MDSEQHIYRARLDFLYQSIAVYAATFVIYLIVRSFAVTEAFPSLWQDPLLLLLSGITLVSVIALAYNLILRRQIEITENEIRFTSRARERAIAKSDVTYVQFGSRQRTHNERGIRVVRIGIRGRRRPVRIRLSNFDRANELLAEIKQWSGPLLQIGRTRRLLRRTKRPINNTNAGARPSGA